MLSINFVVCVVKFWLLVVEEKQGYYKMLQVCRQLIIGIAFIACAQGFAQLSVEAETHTHGDVYLLHESCENVINEQISWETYASLVYLNMAGYFDRPSVARPGFAKFFRDQSLEEYGHVNKFIDYINKRNGTVKGIAVDPSEKFDWSSPREALKDAIKLEKHVYGKIQHLHSVADQKCNDAHLTDFLESYFFVEQVDSIRELQTMLSTITVDDPTATAVIEHMEDVRLRGG